MTIAQKIIWNIFAFSAAAFAGIVLANIQMSNVKS